MTSQYTGLTKRKLLPAACGLYTENTGATVVAWFQKVFLNWQVQIGEKANKTRDGTKTCSAPRPRL